MPLIGEPGRSSRGVPHPESEYKYRYHNYNSNFRDQRLDKYTRPCRVNDPYAIEYSFREFK